ncbi:MAG: R3H domain-containing nucleic acid-binding protein [Candidatus Oleimicrobiaceae bacterium]
MEQSNGNKRRQAKPRSKISKIDRILIQVQRDLRDSYVPATLKDLTAFERKRIHRFFDGNPEFETKTYRNDGDYVLKVFPVGNIRRLAEQKAEEARQRQGVVALPPMGSFERFIVHNALKQYTDLETTSVGEGDQRHVEIRPVRFGRGLKRIIKRIKLL